MLVGSQVLLYRLDTVHDKLHYLRVGTEFGTTAEVDSPLLCQVLEQLVFRNDESRNEFMLVGYDDNLVDVAVHAELRLEHLRSDVLAVARLEKVLDALRHEEFAVLHVAGIACVEPAFLVYRHSRNLGFAVVAFCDGVAFEQYFVVFAELHLDAIKRTTDRAERNGLVPTVARDGGGTFCEAVACNHQDASRADKLLDDRWNGSSGSGEEVASLQS